MKLSIILLVVATLQANARGFAQPVSLHVKDAPLQKVFREVHRQTGFEFFYSDSLLQSAKKVTLRVTGMPVEQLLQLCFKDQPFTFVIANKLIIIKPFDKSKLAQVTNSSDETITINGRVTDKAGNPLVGASVNVHGASHAILTNANGEFLLKDIKEDAIIEISFVGYQTQQVKVNKRTVINIVMEVAVDNLLSVVVNKGYYSTSQRVNTGSVSKVTSPTIEKQPVSNPLAALTGRVAGLDIIQESGLPGTGFTLRLRGVNSVRPEANAPLIIIDGSPYPSTSFGTAANIHALGYVEISPLNSLNPNDIESVEVLKDADATSIYGSRGGNGVILITTKKGKAGKTVVDLNVSSGFARMGRKQKMLSTRQYLDMRYEAIRNDGKTIATAPASTVYDLAKWDTTRYTDWQDLILGNTARYDRAQMSLSGGNDNTSFSFSGSYSKETTIMPVDLADKKYNGRLSINHRSPNKKFSTQFSITYGVDNNELPGWSLAGFALSLPPIAPPVYDSLGKLYWGPADASYQNPLGRLQEIYRGKLSSLVTSSSLAYELLKGLRLKVNLGYNSIQNVSNTKRGQDFFNPLEWVLRGPTMRSTSDMSVVSNTWNVEPQAEWEKRIGPGKMSIMAGGTFQQTKTHGSYLIINGYADDGLMGNPNFGVNRTPYGDKKDYLYNALFGRLNYNIDDKYVLNLTARRDGSSRFAPGKRFGNFGAIGAAWIFSEEQLFKNALAFLSYGKLRASYGTTGNDMIPDYGYLSLYTAANPNFAGAVGLAPVGLANDTYSWETNKKAELALEFALLKDRIQITTSYYRNRSSNQLVNYPLPTFTGFTGVQVNLPAVVQNTGLEFELNTTNIQTGNFKWTTNANITFPRNKLVRYDNLEGSSYANTYMVGHPLTVAKTYHFVRVDPQTGLYVWRNKLGKDTSDVRTLTIADATEPINVGKDFFGGINNSFQYKGFQLDVFLNFSKQLGRFGYIPANLMRGGIGNMPLDFYERRWKQPGDIASISKLYNNPSGPNANSITGFPYNPTYYGTISFIRVKNVALSWSLPSAALKRLKWQNCRLYLQGQNLFTITSYKGWDPENQSNNIPLLRVITAGLQLTF